jgi:hypothetical protein
MFRPHLTYANVVSSICLFVVLGGGAYAAVTLPNNSVKSRNIATGEVKASDIGKNAVTSAKVKNASLMADDFKAAQLPAGPPGPAGTQGVPGPPGVSGPRGPSDAFSASFAPTGFPSAATPPLNLANLDLPAGSYVVFTNAIVTNATDTVKELHCGLGFPLTSPGIDTSIDAGDVQLDPPPGAAKATLSLAGTTVLDEPDNVSLDCYTSGAIGTGSITIADIDIGAVQVGEMHFP